jgi:hypothetical protein
MPAQITAQTSYRSPQKCFVRIIEQCYVIKFFHDEGCTEVEIHQRFNDHYGDSVMSRSEMYRWIRDIKEARGDMGCGM